MRIAIDTGGTFTDCVFVFNRRLKILKVPSTPENPARAIGDALEKVLDRIGAGMSGSVSAPRARALRKQARIPWGGTVPLSQPGAEIVGPLDLTCGTTVGTNALLERRGGRVALVTTAGFEDVLEIGRQARPKLYDFFVDRPAALVARDRRFGLRERIGAEGQVLKRPSAAEIGRVLNAVVQSKPQAVAVCLLFSFVNSSHEKAIARVLRRRGLPVSVSHEILPEFREFERTATTVINAYLAPAMSQYLAGIERIAEGVWRGNGHGQPTMPRPRGESARKQHSAVRIMQSNGGIVSAALAAREPVRTILSGPAGGILGAEYVAKLSGISRFITFDMGGTSTDVALVGNGLRTTNESQVAGLPVSVPMLEIHTVGAGGGSLARFDSAGALRVGPESAGADPGPICYGRGRQATVTDAHLVLGRLAGSKLLGGDFALHRERTRDLMNRARGAMRSVEEFSLGIVSVANSVMEKAIRVISVERGYDPRDYCLIAFGGAGGLHACDLAEALGMSAVLIPQFPGGLSALGILRADIVRDTSQTVRLPITSLAEASAALQPAFRRLEKTGLAEMKSEGFQAYQVRTQRWLDLRYVGQAYELTVPATGEFVSAFHQAHLRRYGYQDPSRPVEVVNIRCRFVAATPKPGWARARRASPLKPQIEIMNRCIFRRKSLETPVYVRASLRARHHFRGPAIVTEYSATTAVPPGWQVRVDAFDILFLTRQPESIVPTRARVLHEPRR